MRRSIWGVVVGILIAAVGAMSAPLARGAEASLAGNWKVNLQLRAELYTLWLVKIEDKAGDVKASLLSTGVPDFKDSKIEKFAFDGTKVNVTFNVEKIASFPVTLYLPREKKTPIKLLGSALFRGQRLHAWMEKTDLDELDPKKSIVKSPALKDFQATIRLKDAKEKDEALRDIEKKYGDDLFVQFVTLQRLGVMAKQATVNEEDVKAKADKAIKFAAAYGPELREQVVGQVAGQLARSKKTAKIALVYAREAEKALGAKAAYEQRAPVLTTLAKALRNTGQTEDAAKIETSLDKEYLKDAIPFKAQKYAGRASKSKRVVVLELFTGAECPPCVAADIAFDAMLKRYKPSDVVLLQYHLHIPRPDPLTNADSEKRAEYYQVEGTPTVCIDGETGPLAAGPRGLSKERYDELHTLVDKQLEKKAAGQLHLTASRNVDTIEIAAEVADLQKTGKDIRLRFVLLEDHVRFVGGNRQRIHHHVVRGFPGGEKGFALEEKSAKHKATVSLKDLTKSLNAYLKEHDFDEDDRPLDLNDLKVVAFVQDVKSKEILQAAQADIGEANKPVN